LKRKPTDSLRQDVYDALLKRLLEGHFAPGEFLNRRAVAKDLGVSVAPVLEAMLQLEMEGFLEVLPRKGTHVRVVRPEDIRGHLLVREALECQAARLYCGRPVKRALTRLRSLAQAVDRSRSTGLPGWRADVDFHRALVGLAGCPELERAFNRVMRVSLFYQLHAVVPAAGGAPRRPHLPLLRALVKATPDRAEKALRAHLRSGKGALFQDLQG